MPHVAVKLYPGRSEAQKVAFTKQLVEAMMDKLGASEQSISVEFEEIPPEKWIEEVYKPYIASAKGTLYKKPGYDPETI